MQPARSNQAGAVPSVRKSQAYRRCARPDDDKSESRVVFRQQFYKTELCRFYQSGCVKGESCCFAHGEGELRIAPDLTKTSLCQDWIDRRCPLTAEACPFAHGWGDMRTTPAFVEYGARQSRKGAVAGSSADREAGAGGRGGASRQEAAAAPPPPRPPRRAGRSARSPAGARAEDGAPSPFSRSSDLSAGSPASQVLFAAPPRGAAYACAPTQQQQQPVAQPRQVEAEGMRMALMLQPWALPGEVPLLPLQLTAAGVLQPQLPRHIPDNQAVEVLLRQAMPDHYDD